MFPNGKEAIYIVFLPTSGFTNVCIKICLFILWRETEETTEQRLLEGKTEQTEI